MSPVQSHVLQARVNTFSADIGCHIFKRGELARHLRIFQVGSGNVQTMLSKRLKRIRIRTILAVVFLAVEKIVLLFKASCVLWHRVRLGVGSWGLVAELPPKLRPFFNGRTELCALNWGRLRLLRAFPNRVCR